MTPLSRAGTARYRVLFLAVVAIGLPALGWASGVRLNITPSIPVGLYWLRHVTSGAGGSISRGTLVLVCLPPVVGAYAMSRGYVSPGRCPGRTMPVGKIVAAIAGDSVAVTADDVWVNGVPLHRSRPLLIDRQHRRLPRLIGSSFSLRRGELWLTSSSWLGFDSRYFGPAGSANICGSLVPLVRPAP